MRTNVFLALAVLSTALAGALPVGAIDLGADLLNVAPTILSISLSGLTSGTLTPSSGTTASVTATVIAEDTNGFADISGVTVGIIKPDGTTVHLAQAAGSFSSGSLLSATYTKTLSMNFYDAAALTTSTYKVKAIATDAAAATGTNLLTLSVFNYGQLVAVNAPASLSLGASLTPGVAGSITGVGAAAGHHAVQWKIPRRIAVASLLTLPASIITNFFQMSMEGVPLMGHPQGWLIVTGMSLLLTVLLVLIAKTKRWF